jgi:hypothetical protein
MGKRFDGRTGPLPGEEVCFECALPDCKGEKHPGCRLKQARDRWRADLLAQAQRALDGPASGTFVLKLEAAWLRPSISGVLRRGLEGVQVHTEWASRLELRVDLVRM